jgi:hypothetical protein
VKRGMLGKHAPVHDARIAKLSDRLAPSFTFPPTVDWTIKVPSWPMLANDKVGDCTCAAVFHMLQCWLNNNGFSYVPQDSDALALYGIVGGFPQQDNGASCQAVLQQWATNGVVAGGGTDEPAYCTLDPSRLDELRYAIANFGGAYLGLAMPLTAQAQTDAGGVWDVVQSTRAGAGDPGSWGGHCVPAVAYGPGWFEVITWGAIQRVTDAFMTKYLDEAYGVVSWDWLSDAGITPAGLDMEALKADMQAL